MQKNPGPQPQRFAEYIQLQNGEGFKLKDCEHIFYYDQYGGWKDEHGNYYNEDGQPDKQPTQVESVQNSERSVSQGSWNQNEDDYDNQFAPDANVQQEFQDVPIQSEVQLAIAKNVALLNQYPKKTPLRVNFEIVDLEPEDQQPKESEIIQQYKKKVKGILNVFIQQSNSGYFVVSDIDSGNKLVNLEGENVIGYDITFDVQPFEEFLSDPLSEKQLEYNLPQFVAVDENEKIFIIHLGDHAGFGDKGLFKEWMKKVKSQITKFDVIKWRGNDKKQKVPIVKMTQTQADKVKGVLYDGKQVTVQEYKPIQKPMIQAKQQQAKQQQTNQQHTKQQNIKQQVKTQQKVEQVTQPTQQQSKAEKAE